MGEVRVVSSAYRMKTALNTIDIDIDNKYNEYKIEP